MKKMLIAIMIIGAIVPVVAKERINISSELSVVLPDGMKQIQPSGNRCIFSAADQNSIVSVFAIEKKSGGWNPKVIDRTFFPGLSIENMVKSKEDWFLQLGRDYIKRYYKQDDLNIVTFSSHTYGTIYVFLFECNDDAQTTKFDQILRSIKYDRNFFENALHVYNCGKIVWFILFIIVSLLSVLIFEITKNEDKGTKWFAIVLVTIVEGVLLAAPLWGNFQAVLAAMLVFFVVNIIGGMWGIYFKADN